MLTFKILLWYILLLHSVLLRKTSIRRKMPGNVQRIVFKESTTISPVHIVTLQFVAIFYYFKRVAPVFCSKRFFICQHVIQNICNKYL